MSAPGFLQPPATRYLRDRIVRETPELERIRRACEAEGLPNVTPEAGAALAVLAAAAGARRALEVGTLWGYSGLWLLEGMGPRGALDTVEREPANAERARANFARAGAAGRAAVHEGMALDVLPRLAGGEPYDLVFLDADKAGYLDYLALTLPMLRPGGVLLADNLFWLGRAWDEAATDDDTQGVRRFTKALEANPNLVFTVLPVGDGLGVAVLRSPTEG